MTSLDQALARSQAFIREGRLTQRERRRVRGKELADALASMGPDIDGPEACPAEWGLPPWFLWCVSTLFFRQTKADAFAWWTHAADGEAPLLKRASALPAEAWWGMNDAFKIACVRHAIARAEPVCRNKDYWPQATAAAQQVCDALEGKGDLEAAYAGAELVRNAASDTATFAFAAVCAANAAWCAGGAPYVTEGSASAESATYKTLADMLLSLIEAECATGGRLTALARVVGSVDDSRPGLGVFRGEHPGTEEETEDHGFKRALNPMPASALFPINERGYGYRAFWGCIGVVIFTIGGVGTFYDLPLVERDQRLMPLFLAVLLMALGAAIFVLARRPHGNDSSHARPDVAGAEAERMVLNRYLASRK